MGFEWGPADLVMFASVVILLPMGIISTADVLAGFSNSGLATVMVLFVIAYAIEKTGCLDPIVTLLRTGQKKGQGDAKSLGLLFYKIGVPIGLLSAFLNNTPIVAMFIPVLASFAKDMGLSPSKVMIPLSYFTILGGTITKIGTSTNLVRPDTSGAKTTRHLNPFLPLATTGRLLARQQVQTRRGQRGDFRSICARHCGSAYFLGRLALRFHPRHHQDAPDSRSAERDD